MASRLGDNPGLGDEFYDPYCELCHKTKRSKVKPFEFCFECYQFLCVDCLVFHSNLRSTKGHTTVRGDDMPKSIADKPPRYEFCGEHPKEKKDHFCFLHKLLICQLCSKVSHKKCSTASVDQACQLISTTEVNLFYDAVNSFKISLQSVIPSLGANKDKLEKQKRAMLNEAKFLYEKIVEKDNKMYQDMKSEITLKYESQVSILSQRKRDISATNKQVESLLSEISELRGKTVDTKVFLKVQEIMGDINKYSANMQNLNKFLGAVTMAFVPRERIEWYLSSTEPMGVIYTRKANPNVDITIHNIWFPFFSTPNDSDKMQRDLTPCSPVSKQALSVSEIKYRKRGSYNIRSKDDETRCWITGMAIAEDGRRLLVDNYNCKVKVFSRDMGFLSSVIMKGHPSDIAVVSDQEAIVSMGYNLVKLDISGTVIVIKRTEQLSFEIQGIAKYQDKLIITTTPASVKMIDHSGMVYWSLSPEQKQLSLFGYVSSHYDGRSSTVIVTDRINKTLTLLDGDTGSVITRRQMKENGPHGVTCDNDGNIYVCCGFGGVTVLTADLSDEEILLSSQDCLTGLSKAIAYDKSSRQLILSYDHSDTVDCFEKTVHEAAQSAAKSAHESPTSGTWRFWLW